MMKKITKIDELERPLLSKTKLRVAAYARVSTDSDEQLISLKAQREHYETYIKSNPEWEFAGLYYDEGISGTKKEKRPELLRMIRDCENGKIDFIVTKSISRFARNTLDCLELVRNLMGIDVYIYFEKENLNTGDMESELMLSREVFSKAQKLIAERAKSRNNSFAKKSYQNRYVLSGRIICGECGSKFRRKTNYSVGRSYIAWSCIGHIEDKDSCSMLFLRDGEIKATFTTMMNKLAFGRKIILEPLYNSINKIDEECDLERIDAIDKRMEQLTEERNTLIGLMTKGFLEPALFNKERSALDIEIKNLTAEKTNLVMSFTNGTSQADEIKILLDYVAKDKFDGDYTEESFEKFVENIIVNSRDELTFKMKCGLSLKEKVVR